MEMNKIGMWGRGDFHASLRRPRSATVLYHITANLWCIQDHLCDGMGCSGGGGIKGYFGDGS